MVNRIFLLSSCAMVMACPARRTPSVERPPAEPLPVDAGMPVAERPPLPIKTVTGRVVDENQRPQAGAVICDGFEADLMMGLNRVPRVIGLRTPKSRVSGQQTACARADAQGQFTLTAPPSPEGASDQAPVGFPPSVELAIFGGHGISRTPARGDRIALGVPLLGAVVRLEGPGEENRELGAVVLKPVQPFRIRYQTAVKEIHSARLSVARAEGSGFLTLDFADALPGYPAGKALPVRSEGELELPLPAGDSYSLWFAVAGEDRQPQTSRVQAAAHPQAEPLSLSAEVP